MKSLKNDVKAWLLLCSGLGTILFLMGSTFYIVVSQSLGLYSMGGEESQFSLEYWQAVLNSPVFQNSYIYSVKVSLLGAILSIIVAYPIAMWLRKKLPAKVTIITILIWLGALGDFAFYSIAGPRSTDSLARLMQMSAYEFEEWNQSAVMALTIMLTSAFFTILVSLLIKPLAVKRGEVK